MFRASSTLPLRLHSSLGCSSVPRHRHSTTSTTISPNSNKIFGSAQDALRAARITSGDQILAGGFGICGIPQGLIEAVKGMKESDGIGDLTLVSNDCGTTEWGLGVLVKNDQVKRMIGSYMAENPDLGHKYVGGQLELELTPQGTLAERLRAGGMGVPAFFTEAGRDTIVENGTVPIKYDDQGNVVIHGRPRETRMYNGRKYLLEESIRGKIGLVKAWQADTYGNLRYRRTAENFNPLVAAASEFTIAEVEEIVPMGFFQPREIRTPGIFVDAIVQMNTPKKIHKLVHHVDEESGHGSLLSEQEQLRRRIAKRASLELRNGMSVNLGIGIPTYISDYIPETMLIMTHCENGILGMGGYPNPGEEDPDCINASKEAVTVIPGASVFDSSLAFGMIRGGHIDCVFLGVMEVNGRGDIANWMIPGSGSMIKGMGGGMDLVASSSRLVACTYHVTKRGDPKIVSDCSLPVTGTRCANRIITEFAVFDVATERENGGLTLVEIHSDRSLEDIRHMTGSAFDVSRDLKEYDESGLNGNGNE